MNNKMRDENFVNRGRKKKEPYAKFPFGRLLFSMLFITVVFAVYWIIAANSLNKPSGEGLAAQYSDDTNDTNDTNDASESSDSVDNPLTYTEMTLLSAGDVMYHNPQLESAFNYQTNTYDFSDSYKYISSVVSDADYSVVNFETTLAGPNYSYTGWPIFNSPDEGLKALIDSGFDMMLFANNHCYDTKHDGLLRTQEMFKQYGIDYIGARTDQTEKTYRTVEINGITLGMLNSTDDISYGATSPRTINGITINDGDLQFMDIINQSMLDSFYSQTETRIKDLNSSGADLIIYFIHWGNEYNLEHNEVQEKIAQKLCDLGVDIIIGGHPHVVQDAQILTSTNNSTHKTLCFYSLGNFISNQNRLTMGTQVNKEYTENGLMVKMNIRKYSNGQCMLTDVETIPTWVHRYYDSTIQKTRYFVIPLPDANNEPEKYGLYESDFGVNHASMAYNMTTETLGRICEAFAQTVSLP